MAGILAIYKKKKLDEDILEEIRKNAFKMKHRGRRHRFKYEQFPIEIILFQQKKIQKDKPLYFTINGKSNYSIIIDGLIYNLNEINEKYKCNNLKKDKNDNLEAIVAGFNKYGIEIFNQLIGSFSGIIFNEYELIGFKDPIGGKPLYYCENNDFFICSSELKALSSLNCKVSPVKPGTARFSSGHTERFYQYPQFVKKYDLTKQDINNYATKLNELVKAAIADNITDEERICALLSGGLDSSIVTYVAKNLVENLSVFTVGVEGSEDIFVSKKFANLYNLNHTVVEINLNDMLECLPDVIFALETFDAALIRSAVPMFLISKKIKEDQGECVLLTGEGGDELFGGYSYLVDSQSNELLNQEILNLLEIEHKTGLQRVDRIPYFFSIEARAPLFDQRLMEFSFKIPPELKIFCKNDIGIVKKWILRKAFENEIPAEFIWRKKQKFSYGAGSQFFLRDHISQMITDIEFDEEKQITPEFPLRSKEELYYWRIFKSKFKPTIGTISEIGITSVFEL
jgi:asparagine synthase (glutamine-hydrolysing)